MCIFISISDMFVLQFEPSEGRVSPPEPSKTDTAKHIDASRHIGIRYSHRQWDVCIIPAYPHSLAFLLLTCGCVTTILLHKASKKQ